MFQRDYICSEFRLETCEKVNFKQEKIMKDDNIILDIDTIIKGHDQEVTYKYLAANKGNGIQHSKSKETPECSAPGEWE